ncbi:MAG TPA: hypothetical protein VGD71_12090 [Kribbella sp.]
MKTFEDELLAELRAVVSEREVASAQRRGFVARHRVVVGLAACATLAVAGTVAVSVVGGDQTTSPAYSVTKTPDGKVTVTIYRSDDAEGLERRLAQAGVTADVTYIPQGMVCRRTPRPAGFTGNFSGTDNWDGHQQHGYSFTLKPADFVGATLMIESTGYFDGTGDPGKATAIGTGFVKTGSYGPCVMTVPTRPTPRPTK